jgi:hypothetical protein
MFRPPQLVPAAICVRRAGVTFLQHCSTVARSTDGLGLALQRLLVPELLAGAALHGDAAGVEASARSTPFRAVGDGRGARSIWLLCGGGFVCSHAWAAAVAEDDSSHQPQRARPARVAAISRARRAAPGVAERAAGCHGGGVWGSGVTAHRGDV